MPEPVWRSDVMGEEWQKRGLKSIPPPNSVFVADGVFPGSHKDAVGAFQEEILVDISVRDGYCDVMLTASIRSPHMPYWNDPEVVRWLQRVNGRILNTQE